MVRVAGLMGQEAAGFAVRSADGLAPAQALAAIRARIVELTTRQARLWTRELRPALAAAGHRDRDDRRVHAEGARAARVGVRARHLPGADAARGRLGSAVPVHLRAVELSRGARRRPGQRRGALRTRQGARGARPLRQRRARVSCRSSRSSPTSCRRSSREWRSPSRRCSASRATPTSRCPTTPTICSRRSSRSSGADASAT